ncbi:gfo/Idh/MocA family oxidoreductase (plasmid) [Azospirillum argentinense]|uniref:Gfo/Idh/MocA family oxidoreductase n=1 Tax=Azospirillum argentinense TaxID=2970906 RepID=A0A4D8PYQ5_9PROT|nr:Gfo/Idh/MocA family oxidoreductase [Azospirillum argentinense]QCN99551.1 gfo/Idh/MocA family oxidoreductase [Azospirillum argentinense]
MTIEGKTASGPNRRLRLGMVGGGRGAFIGAVHRIAARLDDRYELRAGALSSDPERCQASGADLFLPPERCYASFAEMARAEAARDDGIDVVSIVTPNHLHHDAAKAFLEAGIHVICDKPLTTTVEDAEDLAAAVERSGLVFALTHNYTGYPMVRQARAMVAAGDLGALRVVQVEYPQDWLSTRLEESGQKQAEWRTDPARSGIAGCVGDIGTHAFQLAEFVTGLRCTRIAADLTAFVEGRRLDDNAHMMLRFGNGARGMLWASQVAPGHENGLRLRVYGDKGGLEWFQEQPNHLRFSPLGEPPRTITRGGPGSDGAAAHATRIPSGHPEGYLEGFAQIYRDAADLIVARMGGAAAGEQAALVPTVQDGVRGVRFIHAAVESSRRDAAWVEI